MDKLRINKVMIARVKEVYNNGSPDIAPASKYIRFESLKEFKAFVKKYGEIIVREDEAGITEVTIHGRLSEGLVSNSEFSWLRRRRADAE